MFRQLDGLVSSVVGESAIETSLTRTIIRSGTLSPLRSTRLVERGIDQ